MTDDMFQPTINHVAPGAATHDMPCAICRENKAVLDLNVGIFQPCWDCQSKGFQVRRQVYGWFWSKP